MRICRHCCRNRANRPRGLCWPCYYRPGVREHYPPTGDPKWTRRGIGLLLGIRPLPEPTYAAPGSDEKMAVLAGRAGRGEQLFHPDDAK